MSIGKHNVGTNLLRHATLKESSPREGRMWRERIGGGGELEGRDKELGMVCDNGSG